MVSHIEEYPLLIAQAGPLMGQRFTISKPLLIGRESTCEVFVPDRQVSRFHARLMPTPDGIILEDLGSKNGTHCNGNPVRGQIVLIDGDTVQIALVQQFAFLTSDATVPLPESITFPEKLRIDYRARQVWIDKQQISPPLSALQFQVLKVLCKNAGKVVSRQEIIAQAWGDEQSSGVSDQALDALIRRLRDRIAGLDTSHDYIVTIRGHGIRFDNSPLG